VTVNFRPNDSSYSASSATSATYFVASRSNRR
jgi:hypothetical protein